ncbi:MAG: UbiA prenyltransferase family protein, partial [Thermoplasmata archaeon]|nr:UbiA prenyltransferase family protein [Thermoplasmata archaeon]
DYKLDSMVVELKDKPIVSGAVSMSQAIAFTLVTVFAGLIVLAFYFPYTWAIVFWSLSYIWAGHYDAKGKYTAYFFELSLGFTFFFWALFGAAAARPDFFGSLTMNTIAVALVIFCFAVYINWGNAMKDAPTDRKLRVPTRAVVWGYRHKQRLRMSSPHILYAFFIKFWVLLAFSLPILFSRLLSSPLPILSGPPVLLGLDLYSLFFFAFVVPTQLAIVVRARGRHDRAWWTNYIVMDMFLTWLAFAFMAVMVVGVWWSAFLFLLPLLWFAGTTTAIYGRPMRVGL